MRKTVLVLLIPIIGMFLAGCGKANIFSWAHQSGGDTSTESLQSDAVAALQGKDFTKALEYYTKILEKEPNNSEAIYGYSAAQLSSAGLDLGSLIANLIKQQSAAPSRLAPAIAFAANVQQASNLLPTTIDIAKMKASIDLVIPKLARIASGAADGKISPNNPDVNLNLAFCYVLRAAVKAENYGNIKIDTDYKVTVLSTNVTEANDIAKDIVRAYQRMLIVMTELKITDGSGIANIKKDVSALFDDLKTKISGITVTLDDSLTLE